MASPGAAWACDEGRRARYSLILTLGLSLSLSIYIYRVNLYQYGISGCCLGVRRGETRELSPTGNWTTGSSIRRAERGVRLRPFAPLRVENGMGEGWFRSWYNHTYVYRVYVSRFMYLYIILA